MGAVYKSICFELDSLELSVITLSEKEVDLKVDIERMMNEGFVYLAKARYIMGSTCITKTQLPTANSHPIQPVATVCRELINNNWVFKIERKSLSKPNDGSETEVPGEQMGSLYEKVSVDDSSSKSSSKSSLKSGLKSSSSFTISKSSLNFTKTEAEFRNLLQTDPKSIRKSKNAFLVKDESYQDYQNDLLDEISNTDSEESLISVTDPIRLFGVLVPNALRRAQIIFNNVVNILGECATIQSELRETLTKCNHLKNVKTMIEEAAVNAKTNFLVPRVYWTPPKTSVTSCHPIELEGEGEEYYKAPRVSRKSIRSVFYDDKDIGPQDFQEAEYSVFGSDTDSDYSKRLK